MSEIRQQPTTPRGGSVAKKRKRIPESKNNSVQATGFALGSSALSFYTMFGFEVQSFRCDSRPRFNTVCHPLGLAPSDFINLLLYTGIALGIISLVMLVLTFIMRLPDFPRWTVIVLRVICAVLVIMCMAFTRH
jgi:hypothetical protein